MEVQGLGLANRKGSERGGVEVSVVLATTIDCYSLQFMMKAESKV
jgi:hypothetical protein